MQPFTKKTVSTWDHWVGYDYNVLRDKQLLPMYEAGKTDGTLEMNGNTVTRKWVDQAAAQEWVDWVLANTPKDALISIVIEDIT